MKKFRKTIDYGNDALVYVNEDYIVYRKDGQILGTLTVALDLIQIGIIGLEKNGTRDLFKYDHDYKGIIKDLIKQLEGELKK